MRFLSGSPIASVLGHCMKEGTSQNSIPDNASVNLCFEDGSIGTIHYFANGGNSFPKERIEVFVGGRTYSLITFLNYEVLIGRVFASIPFGIKARQRARCLFQSILNSIENSGESPIPQQEIFEVSRVAIEAAGSIL